jgi:hypothetical protein
MKQGGFQPQVQQLNFKRRKGIMGTLTWKRCKTKSVSHFSTVRLRRSPGIEKEIGLHLDFARKQILSMRGRGWDVQIVGDGSRVEGMLT